MNRATAFLFVALVGCLPASQGSAEQPLHRIKKPLERAGRLYGVCWGDGYHACADSGKRLFADLPPQSNLTRPASYRKSIAGAHHHGATFYDRFDALNQSLFHTNDCCIPGCEIVECDGRRCRSTVCDSPGCDRPSCGSPDCDGGCDGDCDGAAPGYGTEYGVRLTPGNRRSRHRYVDPSAPVELPSFSGPPQPEFAAPAPVSISAPDQASDEPSEPLPPAAPAPAVRPSKPAEQTSKESSDVQFDPQPILTAPLATMQRSSPLPGFQFPAEATSVSPLRNAFSGQTDPLVRQSRTPTPIKPPLPTESGSNESQPTTIAQPPSYVQTAPRGTTLGDGSETATQVAPTSVAAKPQRLGQSTGQTVASTAEVPTVAHSDRPTRLGSVPAKLQSNPFVTRPVVEMAKRPSESDAGVVRQPSSLK